MEKARAYLASHPLVVAALVLVIFAAAALAQFYFGQPMLARVIGGLGVVAYVAIRIWVFPRKSDFLKPVEKV